ncbi:MAG: iron-sulfur cluster assembly scaffold protein [Candidatus Nanohalarchaeota archaeon]|nr:MAG: iron-sulfur cluster assembly scaffold protein [Candidatus Nanohaloarchaeota archaeon]
MYSKEVMDHFANPRNIGIIENADGVGKVGNYVCGDIMWIYIKVRKNENDEDIIDDIRFKTMGCAAAIASSSMATELAKGKTISDALKMTKQNIADSLGGLPAVKLHCSLLATDALVEAIYDYLSKNSLPVPDDVLRKHERIKIDLEKTEKMCLNPKAQENSLKKD